MTSREIVKRTILFQQPERLAFDFPEKYGSDIIWVNMTPSPDARPRKGVDEWGAVWGNIGDMILGEVKEFPIKHWDDFEKLTIPDILDPGRWESLRNIREQYPDKFLLAAGISIYERVHFLRGLDNTWMDIYDSPENLAKLIDILVEMNLKAIQKFAELGIDGYIFPDDWGLQNRLMISPEKWREIWKSKYARVFEAAHNAGILTFLHSCGYIVDIMDDLIEIGLDVIQMDQQENMGLALLGEKYGGRITFFSPVDIQNTMVHGSHQEIREYCREMVQHLGTKKGGFIPKWYSDPVGAGHKQQAIEVMCDEFIKIGSDYKSLFR